MADSYTLYIHDPETDFDIDDDIYEPAAFQIPFHMQWKDLQDLICNEVSEGSNLSFTYLDDENDKVKIGSQDEYEVALNLAKKSRRDLHIYGERGGGRDPRMDPRREERKGQEDRHVVNPYQVKDEEVEILRPPVEEEEEKDIPAPAILVDEAPTSLSDQGAAAPMEQDDVVTSTVTEESEETRPMSVANPIIRMIKKEVKELMAQELDEIWEYINEFKKDVNEKLDTIGEHLASEAENQEPELSEEEKEEEDPMDVSSTTEKEEPKDDGNDYAASFVCESLMDGSLVYTDNTFQKYWVFRNEGTKKWDDDTKLHLLEETCTPAASSGNSLSEWGAKWKSAKVPSLSQGESGVVCVEHIAPQHRCDYNSSWRLSQDSNAFGPRVWCNVRVIDNAGSPVSSSESSNSHESFEVVSGNEEQRVTEESNEEQTLVPPQKLNLGESSPKIEVTEHCDNSILTFNMDDISDGAKYLPTTTNHETVPFNPAVSTVVQDGKESQQAGKGSQQASLKEDEIDVEASVDAVEQKEESVSNPPESLVMVQPSEVQDEDVLLEEPKTLEREDITQEEVAVVKDDDLVAEEVENFTETVVRIPDEGSSSEAEEEEDDEPEEEERLRNESSDDLHSVDYNVDDSASMMSYDVSDFVVVPLPECFDVNRPLNVSELEEVKDKKPSVDASTSTIDHPVPPAADEEPMIEPPPLSDEQSSDEEIESQPNSTTMIKEYKSEDSLSTAPKTPTSRNTSNPTSPTASLTPRVNLAPTFVPPSNQQAPEIEPETKPRNQSDSSLTEAITQNFQAFTINPENPPPPTTRPKIPMNQLPNSRPPVYNPNPIPLPQSVLNMDDPYYFQSNETQPFFPPFEQGWRRNPAPIPMSVNDDTPWPKYAPPTRLPESEFTLNRNSNGIESTLPSYPFATAASLTPSEPQYPRQEVGRSPSPTIALPDDFHPVGNDPDIEEFRTPPPSPFPCQIQPSALDQIYEMGFHNMDLNKEIFDQCDGDINRTVQALVLRMEADGEVA